MKTILALLAIFLCFAAVSGAQNSPKFPRLGFLAGIDPAVGSTRFEDFRRALRELGYIEGQNIAIVYRNSEAKSERDAALAAELVSLKVDIIVVAAGLPVLQAAKNATDKIPIVMTGRGIDPVVAGLVDSLARPGGNITGITSLSRELGGKRLELLKDTVAKIKRVAVLHEYANAGSLRELKDILPSAAQAIAVTLQPREVQGPDGFEAAFGGLNRERPDALYVTTSPLMTANLKQIARFTTKMRLPSVGSSALYTNAGGLMSYDADSAEDYRRVARYVDRLLKGAKPAELPIQQPTKFELVINLKAAREIGLTIPPNVLARADRVIR